MLCLLVIRPRLDRKCPLFEQVATERRHLSLLYDIGRKLSTTLDIDEILNHAVLLTAQALVDWSGWVFYTSRM
jgi:hypothetical protein